jgi:hypothetical protein
MHLVPQGGTSEPTIQLKNGDGLCFAGATMLALELKDILSSKLDSPIITPTQLFRRF